MTFRIVDSRTYSEPMHHALDKVLVERLDNGDIDPTLRFWYRDTPAIPLGRFQSYADEVAADYVESRDIDVVRRITGGGAMYVAPGDVITYSMYVPRSEVPEDIEESYEYLNDWAVEVLRDIGLKVDHEPLNDIVHPDGKLGGAAQLRFENAVLHHVTMSYDLDIAAMLSALRIGEEKVSDKAVQSAENRVAVMTDHVDLPRDTVIDRMISSFERVYGGESESLEPETVTAAEELAREKFTADEWNQKL